MKKLRLLFTSDCDRSCPGCVNNQWQLDKLPKVSHFNYDEIIITGGEPLLYPDKLTNLIQSIKKVSNAKIYISTAYLNVITFAIILNLIDGITLTLHDNEDTEKFYKLENFINSFIIPQSKSLRLNIVSGVNIIPSKLWKAKNIKWLEDCPLPENEEFKKL